MYPIRSNSMLTLSDDRTNEIWCHFFFSLLSYHHKNCFHLVKIAVLTFVFVYMPNGVISTKSINILLEPRLQ